MIRILTFYLALTCCLFAQTTKVGGSGTTKVGGSGTTKIAAYVSASYDINTDPNIVERLRADSPIYNTGTTQATNGQGAETWVKLVGNNATQSTGANQLTFVTSAQNGHAAILDDASGSGRWMDVSSYGTISQPFTVAWVGALDSSTSGTRVAFDGISSSDRAVMYLDSATWVMYAGSDASTGASADTSFHIFVCEFNGASSTLSIDGGAPASGFNPGTGSFVGLKINALFDNSLRGKMFHGEFIVRNGLLGADKSAFISQLNSYWATF